VVLILIRRRSASLSSHPFDWALSFSAVSAPLLLTTPAAPSAVIPATLATTVMLAGLLMQISAKLSLWRSFGLVPANRGVKTRGLYRVVRHPVYAGYTLTHLGFLLGVLRMLREEALLGRDPAYAAYAARVRYRVLPGVF